MNVAARRVTLLTLFSAKSRCTFSFRLINVTLYSKGCMQVVKSTVYVLVEGRTRSLQSMLCYRQLFPKIRKYCFSKVLKFLSFDQALNEKSFSTLLCLPLNVSRLIILQLKVGVSMFHVQAGIIQACDKL